jgi:outer membrane protein assembly factor BamC
MKKRIQYKSIAMISLAGSALFLAGCSSINSTLKLPEHKINYKDSKSVKSLEVPPDLTAPEFDSTYTVDANGTVSAAAYNRHDGRAAVQSTKVLQMVQGVQIKRAGSVSWLEVQAPAETLWPKLTAFWTKLGVSLKSNEPRVGLMETEWAENRAGLPMDWLRKALGGMFQGTYDAGSRDKFRLRIERPSSNVTNVFISHRGAEEMISPDGGVKWEQRPADANLEAEILNRLSAFLQGDRQAATTRASVKQIATSVTWSTVQSRPALHVNDNRKRTWLRVGVMLERAGILIEGQDQANGIYKVVYKGGVKQDKQGWLSKVTNVFKGDKDGLSIGNEYQIHLSDSGANTRIMATDDAGQPLNAKASRAILAKLKAEFDR